MSSQDAEQLILQGANWNGNFNANGNLGITFYSLTNLMPSYYFANGSSGRCQASCHVKV